MDQPLPENFNLLTFIVLAQTIYDFLYRTFRDRKKVKTKINLEIVLIFLVLLGFITWIVYFFDYGFRTLIVLLQEGGFNKNWANFIGIAGYYIGYNAAKKLDNSKYGHTFGSDDFIGHLFGYTSIAVLTSIVFGIFMVWVKNYFYGSNI